MTKMYCDKCGEEVKPVPGGIFSYLKIPKLVDPKQPVEPQEIHMHLCLKCAPLVTEFISPQKK